ncbi:MAG: biotin/lipoyl-binding protein, partial [bacterium]|nr:biotin/lipoyl-binding protein [bacterium]
MNTFRKIKNRLAKRPFLYGSLLFIIIIILGILIFRNGEDATETLTIKRANFVNEISVSGKVVATQSADLGFDQSGRIVSVNKKVGDSVFAGNVIASIENGSSNAEVAQRQAAVEREQAKLASLQKGTRPESIAISQQAYTDVTSALLIAMRTAYLQMESVLLSKVDTLFKNGNSVNPTLTIYTGTYNERRLIENQRLLITEQLEKWKSALDMITAPTSSYSQIQTARSIQNETILNIKNFTNTISMFVKDLHPNSSGLSQSAIDEIRSTINAAGRDINSAEAAEQSTYSNWTAAYRTLSLNTSGSTAEDISAQVAQVKAAQADLA